MFKHIFINNLKIYIREKSMIFWLLVFPIILATFFKLAFANLLSGESFEISKIALVEEKGFSKDRSVYTKIYEEMDDYFKIKITDELTANKLLEDGEVIAVIYGDDIKEYNGVKTYTKISLEFKENGMSQSILKSITDKINKAGIYSDMMAYQSEEKAFESLSKLNVINFLEDGINNGKEQNTIVTFFYTVLGMAAMYGATLGVYVMDNIQPSLSSKGMRYNLSPVSKFKGFTSMFAAAAVVQSTILIIIYLYISKILNIDFGERYPYIIFTTIIGGLTGLSIGTLLGAALKKSQELKIGICIGLSMIFSYMSGMMDNSVKYKIEQNMPILAKLNPASLITDAYLKLYYYEDLDVFYENIFCLLFITFVCMGITILILRRQRYDSV
jgi:ABC-2 type transport system permease protein